VTDQTFYQAQAGWLESAVDALRAAGVEVIAPTETESGSVQLAPVTSAEAIPRQYGNVRLPLKEVFFPITEVLLEFEKKEDGDVDVRPEPLPAGGEVVVIGCRPCDVAALEVMGSVFQWDYDDLRYRARRERTTVVALACTKADPECFCTSVGGSPYGSEQSDAIVFPRDDGGALLQVHTDKGRRFLERLGAVVQPAPAGTQPAPPPDVEPRFDPEKVRQWLDENFENGFWTERSLPCLGCGACTLLCPTCHCFDIVDEATWNRGQRRRNWDCCSYPLFTLHASGHNPRPAQGARFRQRVMHKFKYFPERFGRVACVGCGRCTKVCGVGQSLAGVLADIQSR
jgi:ferredoxin